MASDLLAAGEPEIKLEPTFLKFTQHVSKESTAFEENRQKGLHCDLEIRFEADQQPVKAHKIILKLRNTYFERLIALEVTPTSLVDWKGEFQRDMVELLIKYIYVGTLTIPMKSKSILQLKLAARKLEITTLNDKAICDELFSKVEPTNWWLLREMADEAGLKAFDAGLKIWIKGKMGEIASNSDILMKCRSKDISFLAQNASRTISKEPEILEMILNWVEQKAESRAQQLFEILAHVKLREVLDSRPDLLTNALITSDDKIAKMLLPLYQAKIMNSTLIPISKTTEPETIHEEVGSPIATPAMQPEISTPDIQNASNDLQPSTVTHTFIGGSSTYKRKTVGPSPLELRRDRIRVTDLIPISTTRGKRPLQQEGSKPECEPVKKKSLRLAKKECSDDLPGKQDIKRRNRIT